jgi:hypothetical protein
MGPAAVTNNRVGLGFDLRIRLDVATGDRSRESAFLDPRRVSPISADPSVWPMNDEADARWGALLPDFLNPLCLATNLDTLIDAYESAGFSLSNLCPVCITSDPTITRKIASSRSGSV